MPKEIIKPALLDKGKWVLLDITTGDIIGEESPQYFASRKAALLAAAKMWPHGRLVSGGWSFEA